MKNNLAEETQIIGIHTLRKYDTSLPGYDLLENELLEHILKRGSMPEAEHRMRYGQLMSRLETYMIEQKVVKNLITTGGRSVLMQRLANTTTYTGIINYGALGSSSTAVANTDTQLGTEVFRKVVASSSYSANVAFIDFFFTKADTNGTYAEFGTFIDGTGSANSGQIFTHVLTGGWTKSSSESMTISCQYTLN